MNTSIPRTILLAMLDSTARSVGQVGGAGMALLALDDDGLHVTTADGSTEAHAAYPAADGVGHGSLLADYIKLRQVVGSMPDGPVHLASADNRLSVTAAGGARFGLVVADTADFPPSMRAKIGDGATEATFDGPAFALAIGRVAHCVARDENRHGLNGLHMEAATDDDGDALRLVATDGSRLSWATTTIDRGGLTIPKGRMMPPAFAGALGDAGKGGGAVTLTASPAGLSATTAAHGVTVTICGRWIDGEFPDYRQVLPAPGKASAVTVPRADLISALKRVSIMATDRHRTTRIEIGAEEVTLSCVGDLGTSSERVPCRADLTKTWASGINAAYMLDALSTRAGDDHVVLEVGQALDPIVMRGLGTCYVVMPMRVD